MHSLSWLEFLCMSFSLLAGYLNSIPKRLGLWFGLGGSISWSIFNILMGMPFALVVSTVSVYLYLRGIRNWARKGIG